MTNRVDELEGDIAELRAAVNGLTEELVETKERVRQLEDAAEAERAARAEAEAAAEAAAEEAEAKRNLESGVVETTTKSDDHVEVVKHERREAPTEDPSDQEVETVNDVFSTGGSDDKAAASEAANTSEQEEPTDDEAAEQGDIIVA